ncbi:unnamed protein product, partial [Brachionus calyciflorus]
TCWPNFELYTKARPSQKIIVTPSTLASAGFSHWKDTKFIVHGFSSDSNGLLHIKDAILNSHDVNVIIIDWKSGAQGPDYFAAASNTRIVGQKMAAFIGEAKLTLSKVHCIGHSLGSHVCGFTSKLKRLGRISGMDPAGPLFKGKPADSRLDKSDADFVDIIHTDSTLGIQDPIGHIDFYPNGGGNQPGCLTRMNSNVTQNEIIELRMEPKGEVISFLSCSHSRVHYLYAESVRTCNYAAVSCTGYDAFKQGRCSLNSCASLSTGCSLMGYKAHKLYPQGKQYLDTTKNSPYC